MRGDAGHEHTGRSSRYVSRRAEEFHAPPAALLELTRAELEALERALTKLPE